MEGLGLIFRLETKTLIPMQSVAILEFVIGIVESAFVDLALQEQHAKEVSQFREMKKC